MPSDGSPELVVAGRRLRTKLVIALTLSSVVPLLVLAYLVRSFVLPSLAAKDSPGGSGRNNFSSGLFETHKRGCILCFLLFFLQIQRSDRR